MGGLSYRSLEGPLSLLGTSFQMPFGPTALLQLSTFDFEKFVLMPDLAYSKPTARLSPLLSYGKMLLQSLKVAGFVLSGPPTEPETLLTNLLTKISFQIPVVL